MSEPRDLTPPDKPAGAALLAEQRRRWLRGERIAVETLLEQHRELCDNADAVLDLVYNEILLRERDGVKPSFEEYQGRFPHLAGPLRLLFELEQALGSDLATPRSDGEGPAGWAHPEAQPVLDDYEILGELGRGGMGVVYKAHQRGLNRIVALKMVLGGHPSAEQAARFRREAEAVACLQHPNVVQIFEIGERDGRPFFALEYVAGGSLAERLRGVPLPAADAAALVQTLADAVEHAHRNGIVHRDLKPANVLLQAHGSQSVGFGTPKITDFGLAKLLVDEPSGQTSAGAFIGTPSYAAPEQVTGISQQVGPPADVYALGAILYECLTGRPPFQGATPLDTLHQVRSQEPVPPSRLQQRTPRDLETITLKCLQKAPHRRYPRAAELAEDLRRFRAGEPIRARPVGSLERRWRWCQRQPALAATLGVAAVALAAVVVLSLGLAIDRARAAERLRQDKLRLEQIDRERRASLEQSALLALDRGLALCEQGDTARGLLWLTRALEIAPEDADGLQRAVRANLADWRPRCPGLSICIESGTPITSLALSLDGVAVLAGGGDPRRDPDRGEARLWSVATGAPLGPTLPHPAAVRTVALAPDGRTAVLAGGRMVRVWDAVTGQPLGQPHVHDWGTTDIAISPDGATLLTTSFDGQARRWDLKTGKPVGEPLRYPHPVLGGAFSPEGGSFLFRMADTVRVFAGPPDRPRETTLEHPAQVLAAAYGADGKLIVTGCHDHAARVWDVATGKALGAPMKHASDVWAVALSPDGGRALTGTGSGRLNGGAAYVWERAANRFVLLPRGSNGPVETVAFSPDGKSGLTRGTDGVTELWDVGAARLTGRPLPHPGVVSAAAYGPEGRTVLTAQGHWLRVWQLGQAARRGQPFPPGDVVSSVMGADGRTVLAGVTADTAQLWEVNRGAPLGQPYPLPGLPGAALALSPVTDRLLLVVHEGDRAVRLRDAATGQCVGPPLEHDARVHTAAFRRDGKAVATGATDGEATVWDVETGKALTGPCVHRFPVQVLTFSPDGRTFLSGSGGPARGTGDARLWDAETGRLHFVLPHQDWVTAVAYSPDGTTLLTASLDMTARLWDAVTGQPRGEPLSHRGAVHAAALSPDGRLVLTGGADRARPAQIWEVGTGKTLGPPLHHAAEVAAVAFSPDGRTVLTVTGGFESTARFWDVATCRAMGQPLGQTRLVRPIAFSPDGTFALTGGPTRGVQTWQVPAPVAGTAPRLSAWVQVLTGLEIDAAGGVAEVDGTTWRQRRQRLEELGGPPLP